ncbi:MAG: hypothetical protein C4524_06390 [Candidatus Zixiibacteriota bacterium]|nr:MAG: hypothetical protein C4524_06390 [candidate division Zixibacteria bacterium]
MNRAAGALLGLALAARLLLVFLTAPGPDAGPVPYFNDEPAHLNYVRYLDAAGRLPVQTGSVRDQFDQAEFEYYQPPLYYLLAQPLYDLGRSLFPAGGLYGARLASVILSLGGLAVLYPAVRRFSGRRDLAAMVLLLGALSSIPLRFSTLVTNDSLLFALACLYFAVTLEALGGERDWRLVVTGALAAAAGLWTKASFLLVLPFFPLALLASSESLRSRGIKALTALILPLAAILPWYLRNLDLYGRMLPLSVGFGPPQPLTLENAPERLGLLANYFTRTLIFPYDGWWGGFPGYLVFPLAALAFAGFVIMGAAVLWRGRRTGFWIFLGAGAAVTAGYLGVNWCYPQGEARTLMPALPFLLTLAALGASRLAGRSRERAWLGLGLWIVLPWVTLLF